jgi:Asp-tRNA(Asn)/Glu-tRNA(Gln) amidotransferase A subunit family amidase
MLQALAGYDARDLVSSENPETHKTPTDYTSKLSGDVSGLRLGVPSDFFSAMTDPEVQDAFNAAVQVLSGLGAQIQEVSLPDLQSAWSIAETLMNVEANVWHEPYLQTQADDYGPRVRRFLERGQSTSATDYVKAQHARTRLRQDMLARFSDIDALLTPGALIPAPAHDARSVVIHGKEVKLLAPLISATCPFNVTGQPALSVPCGFTAARLPIALQIVGKPFDEATILQVGHAYEVHTDWHERRPGSGV